MKALSKKAMIDEIYMALVDLAEDHQSNLGEDDLKEFKMDLSYDEISQLLADKLSRRGFVLTEL